MPEYLSPGVYVEEKDTGPKSIQGVSTSTAGFLGETERGPTKPQFLQSFADFQRAFGGFELYKEGERLASSYLAYAVEGFFRNGGQRCYVGRIEAEDMPTADAVLGPVPEPPPSRAGELDATPHAVEFGPVPTGVTARRTVELTNRGAVGDPPVEVATADFPAGAPGTTGEFEVERRTVDDREVTLPYELAAGKSMVITVAFAPEDTGDETANLEVTHDGTTESPLGIEVTGSGVSPTAGELGVSGPDLDETPPPPPSLDLGTTPLGVPRTSTVTLRHLGGPGDDEIAIDRIEAPEGFEADVQDPQLGETPELSPGMVATVAVTYAAETPGSETGVLRIHHDAANTASPLEIDLEGESGPIRAEPSEVDFLVGVGQRDDRSVEVTNESGGNVTLQTVDVPDGGDEYDVALEDADGNEVDLDSPLESGDSVFARVSFEPTAPGRDDVTLRIAHGGTASPTDVPIRATGGVVETRAVGPGVWGTNVAVRVERASLAKPDNDRFKLVVRYWATDDDARTARRFDADTDVDEVPDPDAEEVYDNLSPDQSSADFYGTRIDGTSNLVTVTRRANGSPGPVDSVTWLDRTFADVDLGSPDLDVDLGDYQGVDETGERTGLAAFTEIDGLSIVSAPDEVRTDDLLGLTGAIVDHCERERDRFAVLQPPRGFVNQQPNEQDPPRESEYAAFYYPWIRVVDPVTNERKLVPPGGHVAGIYARTDVERGVHKAPANEIVRGALELQATVTKGEQDVLNPKGVNCIRTFAGGDPTVWGARTTTTDASWRYINVRRLFLFIEESIEEGTQFAVFEPNDRPLWATLRQSVGNFLTNVWRDGALVGETADEAFYVRCDRTTMTQADIDEGRVIVEVGVAPVKPAEFVVFRISQSTANAEGA